jgi:riboflavin transporter FmnP
MNDPEEFFKPVDRSTRQGTVAILAVVVTVLSAIELLLAASPFMNPQFKRSQLPELLAIMGFLGLFLGFCIWFLVRLLRGTKSENGVTLLPTWTIQGVGVLFLAGAGLIAWDQPGEHTSIALCVMCGLGGLYAGSALNQRKRWDEGGKPGREDGEP